jgi:hypothetical protein
MAGFKTQSIDDAEVGQSSGQFFQPSNQKQRIALVPAFISAAELEISDDLRTKVASGDPAAVADFEDISRLKSSIDEGLDRDPPSVLKVKDPKEGYLFAKTLSHFVHYTQGVGYWLCKRHEYEANGLDATCCAHSEREAMMMYAVVLLVYETDAKGQVIKIPEARQMPLDASNKLDFKYSLKTWTLSDPKMREWKRFKDQNPLVCTDYEVWTEKQGAADRIKFSPCRGDAKWMTKGPSLLSKVLKEGGKMWDDVGKRLGKDLSINDIDTMFGQTNSRKVAPNERNFSGLLTGGQ